MANINVKFNNKDYLLSCDDGQEEDLINLTKFLDKKYSVFTKGHRVVQGLFVDDDYVIATGRTHSIRDMISLAFSHIGLDLTWSGEGVDTMATDQNGVIRVRTNPKFFRPAEVDLLIGDPAYAKEKLGWEPEITAQEMCAEMVREDLKAAKRQALLNEHQMSLPISFEN